MQLLPGGKTDKGTSAVKGKDEICRTGLLAKVHIAKKELRLSDDQYRALLRGFRAESAAELSIEQLERFIKYLKYLGWKPFVIRKRAPERNRVKALQERAEKLAKEMERGEEIMAGLVKNLFNLDHFCWLVEEEKLRRVLAILGKMKKQAEKRAILN